MGKKKLTEKQKKELIAQRKKKEKETRDIISALAKQNQNQKQSEILNNCKSVKNIHTNQKEQKRAKQEIKYQQKKKNSQQIEIENEEEEEDSEEEQKIEPNIQKKVKKSENIEEEKPVNIFAMSNFVNKEYEEVDIEAELKAKEPQTKHEIQAQLENEAKKAFPDLNFEVFEGQKTIKRIQEQEFNQQKQEKEEIQESDHEEIVDEQLLKLVKNYKKQVVQVTRTEQIQEVREKLPVFFKEQEILEAVNQNLITILCGETGSGKSTQVPQFLYEAGYGNPDGQNPGIIGITQPRRLAAVSLAKRVAEELNSKVGEQVIYQVRHEASNFNEEKSKIKFMTDGILLNEMGSDFLLTKYSVIVVDEAHERKINTDLLLGLLSRLVNIRLKLALEKKGKYFPLRVIIMSATLRITDFTENKYLLPKKVNVINVQARQFPVNIYFSKRTNYNYIEEAVKKCVSIHTKLPPGDVLVFLTGEREIKEFIILLESALQKKKKNFESIKNKQQNNLYLKNEDFELNSDDEENEDEMTEEQKEAKKLKKLNDEENTKIISHNPLQSEFPEEFKTQEGETEDQNKEKQKKGKKLNQDEFQDFVILPLYSKLSMEEQDRVFQKKENQRMFVISTNVAETSLTIPNTKYVVDTGKEKKKVYTSKLAISKHVVAWTSQASGNQRTGRAGRTCAGYCYRLYAPSVFGNIMEKFSDPEILNTPLENVILHLKNIGIKDVLKFPFPTKPDLLNLNLSLQNLIKLKALEIPQEAEGFNNFDQDDNYIGDRDNRIKIQQEDAVTDNTTITELGKVMSYIPLNPKFSKMILQGRSAGLLGYTLLIVSFLSVEEIFNKEAFKVKVDQIDKQEYENFDYEEMEDEKEAKRKELKDNLSMLKEIKEKQKLIYEARKQEISNFKNQFNSYLLGKSDIFVGMNILGEFICQLQKVDKYEIDQNISAYAKEKGLLSKALKEIYFNLNQLIEILDSLIEDQSEKQEQIKTFFQNYEQPDVDNIQTLTEIVISGFVDKVARKITYLDEKNLKKTAYETIETLEKVFLNPKSYQSSAKPDFVCYTEITETKKKFINNITTIDQMAWLYKYDYYNKRGVEYLKEPRPQFNSKLDQLQVKVNYQFGSKKWDLPPFWSVYENESYIKYCHIARCLMEGYIFDYFKVFKKYYNMNVQMIKPSNINPAVTGIINALKNNNMDSKQKLLQMWEEQPKFLKEEVLQWIKKENKKAVQAKWPPKM